MAKILMIVLVSVESAEKKSGHRGITDLFNSFATAINSSLV